MGSPVAEGEGEDSILPCVQESRARNDVLDVAATSNGTGDWERDGVLCGHDVISCGIATQGPDTAAADTEQTTSGEWTGRRH